MLVERGLEHHELICQVFGAWTPADDGRFYFRKDFSKYELFRNPTVSVLDIKGAVQRKTFMV